MGYYFLLFKDKKNCSKFNSVTLSNVIHADRAILRIFQFKDNLNLFEVKRVL